jgi:hypothetical protein
MAGSCSSRDNNGLPSIEGAGRLSSLRTQPSISTAGDRERTVASAGATKTLVITGPSETEATGMEAYGARVVDSAIKPIPGNSRLPRDAPCDCCTSDPAIAGYVLPNNVRAIEANSVCFLDFDNA